MAVRVNEDIVKSLGMSIMKRRQALGLTQAELARRIGIEQHSLSRIEQGVFAPKMSRLQDIAENLGCNVDDLFRPDGKAGASPSSEVSELLDNLPQDKQMVVLDVVKNLVRSLLNIGGENTPEKK